MSINARNLGYAVIQRLFTNGWSVTGGARSKIFPPRLTQTRFGPRVRTSAIVARISGLAREPAAHETEDEPPLRDLPD